MTDQSTELALMDSAELMVEEEQPKSLTVEAARSAAIQSVQAPFVIAKNFPRSEERAVTRILTACRREGLAKVALYKYPRGGKNVTGPSIRLAEVLAQAWGNLSFGMREIECVDGYNGYSVIESYCHDFETNVHQVRTFKVWHKVQLKDKKIKHLTDPRDIYELAANYGSRRTRACILAIIPKDITERAVAEVQKTLKSGAGVPLQDRISSLVSAFDDIGVKAELIEKYLGHDTSLINDEEIVDLRAVWTSLKDGETKRADWFPLGAAEEGGRAGELNERLKKGKTDAPEQQ